MCSVSVCSLSLNNYPNFGKKNDSCQISYADEFVQELKKQEQQQLQGRWIQRNLGTTTGVIPVYLAIIYQFVSLFKMKKANNSAETKNIFLNRTIIPLALGVLASFGINAYLNSKSDDNYQNIKDEFKKINTDTDAELSDKIFYSNITGAFYNAISGKIQLNKNMVIDPLTRRRTKKLIKHELVHARQYETVARSENGIRKINYSVVNGVAKNAQEHADIKLVFEKIYQEMQSSPEKYKNTKIALNGGSAEVDYRKYIEAVNILIHNPDAGLDDIPIIIDEEHYQKIINERGALSPEEEIKADKYYEAMLNYSPINFKNWLNPASSYRQNLLEQEAYQENPTFYMKVAKFFGR